MLLLFIRWVVSIRWKIVFAFTSAPGAWNRNDEYANPDVLTGYYLEGNIRGR